MAAPFPSGSVIPIHPARPESSRIRVAAAAIRRGEVIAIPTDTVYGLAGNPFRAGVAERIRRIKRRAENQPILLLITSMEQLSGLVRDVPESFRRIAAAFWPGPLTIILPASKKVPPAVTAGTGAVAVRWPAAAITQALIRAAGRPLTGTSANLTGLRPAATAAEVIQQLGNSVYYIIDGGPAPRRRPSTILDLTTPPRIVRKGAVPATQLAKYL